MPLSKVLGTTAIACSGGSKGGCEGDVPSPSPICFHFHTVSAKIMPNNRLVHPSGAGAALMEILYPALASICNYKICVLENSHEELCNC